MGDISSTSSTRQNNLPGDVLARMAHLQVILEKIHENLDRQQNFQNRHFENLKSETNQALEEVRFQMELLLQSNSKKESPLSFDVPIQDEKLKKVWFVLFRYPEGAPAKTIAAELSRHRSTVSTFLNMLVRLGYSEKFRKGHEIYYKAILKATKEND